MGRRAARVARVADVAQHVAGLNDVALAERAEALQVRIVVPLESWSQDSDDLTAEPISSDACHDSTRGGDDRCPLRYEDVDPFMAPSARSRRAPGVRKSQR